MKLVKHVAIETRNIVSSRLVLAIFIVFLIVCALGGGASRNDAFSQPFVQGAAIVVIGANLILCGFSMVASVRTLLIFCFLCAIVVCAQLVPIPFDWWKALPGHQLFAQVVEVAGIDQGSRPLTLSPDLTVIALLSLLPPAAAIVAAASLGPGSRVRILSALTAITVVSAIMGLLQLATGSDSPFRLYAINSSDATIGLFANRNHHAILMAIGIPILAVSTSQLIDWRMDRRVALAIGGVGILFLFASVLVAGSRGGLMLALIALPLAWMLARSSLGPTSGPVRGRLRFGAGWYAAAAIIAVIGVVVALTRTQTIERLLGSDPLAEQRITGFSTMIRMIRDFMPFGSGFGSFANVYRAYEPTESLSLVYLNQAHNDGLQLLIEAGLPGLGLIAVVLAWWLRRVWMHWLGTGVDDMRRRTGRLGTGVIGMLMVASVFDYPLRTPLLAVVFALAGVMVEAGRAQSPRSTGTASLPS